MDPKTIVRFLKENRVTLSEEEEADAKPAEVKEGDKVTATVDDKKVEGTVVEVHDDTARVKDSDDEVHTVKVADITAA